MLKHQFLTEVDLVLIAVSCNEGSADYVHMPESPEPFCTLTLTMDVVEASDQTLESSHAGSVNKGD